MILATFIVAKLYLAIKESVVTLCARVTLSVFSFDWQLWRAWDCALGPSRIPAPLVECQFE
jgi:hypothetical protein